MKKEIYKGIIISVSFSLTTLFSLIGYAWINDLGGKNTGDTVTAQIWNDLVNNVESLNGSLIPSGFIGAFNLSSCPSGWNEFTQARGRTLVGIGNGTDINSYSTGFTLLQQGGEYVHKLSIAEMPTHSHTLGSIWLDTSTGVSTGPAAGYSGPPGSSLTSPDGGDQPHSIVQPYIAILYCIKD